MELHIPNFKTLQKERAKQLIEEVLALNNSADRVTVKQFIFILNELLRIKGIVSPVSEVMIVVSQKKPDLYHAARLSISQASHLKMLFEIRGDAALAEERLLAFCSGIAKAT
ncbi:MAG: hypothetical protein DF221_00905 [Brevibacillus sp.]|jgi:hypothetical protein|nr:MAG: hypothetical protein DF221_00905 [Brevibacillus sp.]